MFDSQDRRSALLKLFAGAGAAAAAITGGRGASAAADVDAEKKKKPSELWEGGLVDPQYTPIGAGDTIDYLITAQGGGDGVMIKRKKKNPIAMTQAQLFAYMQAKSGGDYTGMQCLRLQGMNWRLMGADYDEQTNTWQLQTQVCDSNPDARPNTQATGKAYGDEVSGCSCGCGFKCYQCRTGRNCGSSFRNACGNG